MSDVGAVEAQLTPGVLTASSLERRVVRLISYIPGLRGLAPSPRVIKAVRGGTWTLVGYGASQILKLSSTLILARILAPQNFGLVALVNVFLSGLEMLSDLGIGMDVVQHPRGDDPVFVNTAFLIQVGRGAILFAIAASFSYPFAAFYHQPAVVALLVVGALSVLLRGVNSGSLWGLTRHVQLGKYNLITVGSDSFGFAVSLTWALVSPTAWALVVGRVAASFMLAVVSHLIADHPVTMRWDTRAARDILSFGSGMVLGTGTYFLCGEAERLVVAKFISLAELGCFSIALSVSAAAGNGLQQIVSQVFFPMISKSLRDDRQAAIRHFKKVRYVVSLGSMCVAVGFITGSHWFVSHVLGPKYEMAGWMLQLLGVRGALELFTALSISMLFALGTSKYGAIGNISRLTFLAIGLPIALGWFNFHTAVWVLTLAPLATYAAFLFGLKQHCREVLGVELKGFVGFATVVALAAAAARAFPSLGGF